MRRPATTFEASAAAWRLVVAATARAFAKRRATVAGRVPVGRLAHDTAITEIEHLLAVVRLGVAPGAGTIFPKHPHVEGHITVILEVEGAPPAQAARAGERLPTMGQSYVARGRDFNRDLGGPAAAVVRL